MRTNEALLARGYATWFDLMEVSAFMTEQLRAQITEQRVHDKAQRQEMETQRREMEAKLEAQRSEFEAKLSECKAKLDEQRQKYEAKLEQLQAEAIEARVEATAVFANQIASLQARLEALYDAKLLQDDEMHIIEDKVADAIGAAGTDDIARECAKKMVKLSDGIASDKMFARQLRRKFL